jgi:hypothetical protein
MRLTVPALLVIAACVTSSCEGGHASQTASGSASTVVKPTATFRACKVPSGGYRVRAFGLRCSAARDVVRHFRVVKQLDEFRFRDPSTRPLRVSREVVWRAAHGWTCLAQALPRVRVTQWLCARGDQVLLWRFA